MPTSTSWRATGAYSPVVASKAGLLPETRLYLEALGDLGDPAAARQRLMDGGLPQQSRYTRRTILEHIQRRLLRWQPPQWVLDDLVAFARTGPDTSLPTALLLHACRQDVMLYDFVQTVVAPGWQDGAATLLRSDAQRFLDDAAGAHPEVDGWSHQTRVRVASGMLTVLEAYGLLRGRTTRTIVEPVVPEAVAFHLVRLLTAEGVPAVEMAGHPDWNLWLWQPARAQSVISRFESAGVPA